MCKSHVIEHKGSTNTAATRLTRRLCCRGSAGAAVKSGLTRADKKRLKAAREAEIAAAERARLAGPGGSPESSAEYEQQLLAAPNNSYLWIKYMAFQLKLGEGLVGDWGGGVMGGRGIGGQQGWGMLQLQVAIAAAVESWGDVCGALFSRRCCEHGTSPCA